MLFVTTTAAAALTFAPVVGPSAHVATSVVRMMSTRELIGLAPHLSSPASTTKGPLKKRNKKAVEKQPETTAQDSGSSGECMAEDPHQNQANTVEKQPETAAQDFSSSGERVANDPKQNQVNTVEKQPETGAQDLFSREQFQPKRQKVENNGILPSNVQEAIRPNVVATDAPTNARPSAPVLVKVTSTDSVDKLHKTSLVAPNVVATDAPTNARPSAPVLGKVTSTYSVFVAPAMSSASVANKPPVQNHTTAFSCAHISSEPNKKLWKNLLEKYQDETSISTSTHLKKLAQDDMSDMD